MPPQKKIECSVTVRIVSYPHRERKLEFFKNGVGSSTEQWTQRPQTVNCEDKRTNGKLSTMIDHMRKSLTV